MTAYECLVLETLWERERFLSISLIKDALGSGTASTGYLNFLKEAYNNVKHTMPLLALAASRTTNDIYRTALAAYVKEARGHEKCILDDIRTLGGDENAVRGAKAGEACEIMVAYAHYAIENISPYALLGSVYVLERISLLLADCVANQIKAASGSTGGAGFSYLQSRGSVHLEQVFFFRYVVQQSE